MSPKEISSGMEHSTARKSRKTKAPQRIARFILVGVGLKALIFGAAYGLANDPHQAAQALLRSTLSN